jgi:hypothetical protein
MNPVAAILQEEAAVFANPEYKLTIIIKITHKPKDLNLYN